MGRLITVFSVGILLLGCSEASKGCGHDNDCKGDRVCEAGMCVSPIAPAPTATSERAKPAAIVQSTSAATAKPKPPTRIAPTPPAHSTSKLDQRPPRLGAQVPVVVITEFGDFQCQFCRQATGSIRKLIQKFGAPKGDLAYEWRHNPLTSHDKALDWAAAAAAAHRQNGFWPMHDQIFHQQHTITDEKLRELARGMKLNIARWEKDRTDTLLRQHILRDRAIAIALGARGTPAFFVNGRLMLGMQSDKEFEQTIETELKKAAVLLKAGQARKTVAATLQRENNPEFAKYLLDNEPPPSLSDPAP